MQLYPFKLKPIYKHRIWGGQKLRKMFGKNIPEGEKIGESWELADLPEDKSVIVNGQLSGQTLISAVEKYRQEITGDVSFRGPFPLLVKFLDAEDVLSVQVHPDSQTCRRMGRGDPKTECWYIISAAPGAVLYKGLKKGVTREAFAEAIREGTAAELLGKIEVAAGECHFLPAGTAHSIGAGLLVAEVQTPSDTTYRVFDWNRVDDSGRPRQLHIDDALESINFGSAGEDLPVTTVGRLVDSEYFKIDKGHQASNCEVLVSPGLMRTLVIINGRGRVMGDWRPSLEFKGGDCLLVPAACEGVIKFVEDTEYLTITI